MSYDELSGLSTLGEIMRTEPWKWRAVCSPVPGCNCFMKGDLSVIVGIEDGRWHLSISHPRRYPDWGEIKEARYLFVPDEVVMAMILPPKREYINLHPNCFHLHELREEFPLQPKGREGT